MAHRTIHIFRKGLRLHDNPTLVAALESSDVIFPVYILDKSFMTSIIVIGCNRWNFLLESLEDLSHSLQKLNSRLLVIQGDYKQVLRDHVQKWNITQVTVDLETEPYYKQMDDHIGEMGKELGFQVVSHVAHTLYDVRNCALICKKPPPPPYQARTQGWVSEFRKPQTVPNSLLPSTTGLSPFFSLGCLSVKVFYQRLSNIYAQSKNHSLPPVSLQGQLLWREFFYTVASCTPNFTKMVGNPICLQIDWYEEPEKLNKWKSAQTGFPWIDAIMTQLREEGWVHHLARHAVACFLTRGDLWISWEEGMKVFEELLLDADYSINAGNWMWLSASAFFHHYTRIFCPVRFGRRTDPEGSYIRKYLPILKDFPAKYIYEPWTAPDDIQKEASCIIGKKKF
uniref:Photolyase/cryptochrome alpha/beta domain-containing protein n=1 Tax=Pyxicephalus adspersus TaxID=30357 RepID=A0AAV3BA66_PYXAD|nr:TPA: hypothetical protein GDO54_001641 [Pyxicephalus adspersus]